jgi:hypothetical protein
MINKKEIYLNKIQDEVMYIAQHIKDGNVQDLSESLKVVEYLTILSIDVSNIEDIDDVDAKKIFNFVDEIITDLKESENKIK